MHSRHFIYKDEYGIEHDVEFSAKAENVEESDQRQFVTAEEKINIAEIPNLKKSVSDGKKEVAAAITDMNVPTEATDPFAVMAGNIRKIKTGIDPSGLTAEDVDVVEGSIFIGRYGTQQTGQLPDRSGDSEAILIKAENDKLYLFFPYGAYRTGGFPDGESDVYADFADIRPLVGYDNQNYVLENTTILGAKGKMPNLANQNIPRDGNTANVIGIGNLWETASGKGSDITIAVPNVGYFNNTKINQAIYGLHPDIIQFGALIGSNPGTGGFNLKGNFTGDANALEDYMLEGQIAYSKGKKLSGKMKNQNNVDPKIGGINKDWPNVAVHKASNPQVAQTTVSGERLLSLMCPTGYYGGSYVGAEMSAVANLVGARSEYILKGHSICDVPGGLAVNSAFSFSIAAISSTEVEIYWINPSKGPFSGVFVEMSTSGYPTIGNSTRVYTGMGTNRNPGGRSSCKITGLQPQTKYYFTVTSYCDGLPNGNAVNLTTTTGEASGQQTFTTSGTFTVPANVTALRLFAVGGGAGGSDVYNTNDRNGQYGGGGSGKTATLVPVGVTPGEQLTILIGAGGARNQDGAMTYIKRGNTNLLTAAYGYSPSRVHYDPSGGDGGSGGGAGGGDGNGSDSNGLGYAGNGGANGSKGDPGYLVRVSDSENYNDTYQGGTGQGSSTYTPSGNVCAGGGAGALLRRYTSLTVPIPAKGGDGIGGNGAVLRNAGNIPATNGASGTGSGGGGGAGNTLRAGTGASGMAIIMWGGL